MRLTHSLKGACFQPSSLSSEKPVSKFAAFKCNLYRYTVLQPRAPLKLKLAPYIAKMEENKWSTMVGGLYKLS
jgi:hypothetical protein